MSDVKVSVIMPFHNGSDYIEETMGYILAQTLKEIEIICVDDESTDDTVGILRNYEKEDSRIRVFEQPKANAGAARNLGLQNAVGEYVLFLDSDDLFEPELLERMYAACKRDSAEMCVCNADQYDTEKKEYVDKPQYLRENFLPEEIPFSRETIGKYILYFTTSVPWNKMISRSFLAEHEIDFQEIARANDQYFSIMCLVSAKSITIERERLIHYRVCQKENLTTRYSETPLCSYEAMLKVHDTLQGNGLLQDPVVRCALDNKILNLMLYSLNIQSDLNGYRQLYNQFKDEGFHALGFELQEREYYFNPQEYSNLLMILENTCEQYLLLKNREYRDTIGRKNNLIKNKDGRIKELQGDKKELQREKKELQKKEKELLYIKSTKRYKFMAMLTAFYHKLRGAGKGNAGK